MNIFNNTSRRAEYLVQIYNFHIVNIETNLSIVYKVIKMNASTAHNITNDLKKDGFIIDSEPKTSRMGFRRPDFRLHYFELTEKGKKAAELLIKLNQVCKND